MYNNINELLKDCLLYTISFSVGIFIITYLLNIPTVVSGEKNIIDEYYIKNFVTNIPMDYIFVLIYFLIAYLIIYLLNIENIYIKTLIVGLTTALLTFGFTYYFINKPLTNNIYSRWFHTVKYNSITYDTILITFIYIIYSYLIKKLN
jgi:hypothetical protein